jgi:hypothetical protein
MTDNAWSEGGAKRIKVFGSSIIRVAPDLASIAVAVSRIEQLRKAKRRGSHTQQDRHTTGPVRGVALHGPPGRVLGTGHDSPADVDGRQVGAFRGLRRYGSEDGLRVVSMYC